MYLYKFKIYNMDYLTLEILKLSFNYYSIYQILLKNLVIIKTTNTCFRTKKLHI